VVATGSLTQRFELQKPTQTRNSSGESVTAWTKVREFMGSIAQETYSESQRRGQIGGTIQSTVRTHWVDGAAGNMRLVWKSRGNRILMIAGVVEIGRPDELELTVEEQAA
jgi:head-tail adaptor